MEENFFISESTNSEKNLAAISSCFDPDLSPRSETNISVASVRGLKYDPLAQAYVDADGCLILDRYGQRF